MNQLIENYNTNALSKTPLKNVVDCFKGKAFSSTITNGNIAVINLSNMTETGIKYSELKTIASEQPSILRYLLRDGDVLVASKGTIKKVAVFEEQDIDVVASANITILRPKSNILGAYIMLFLLSPLGQALLEEADTGKNIMNINTDKLISIEIPVVPLVKQTFLIQRYNLSLNDYKRKLTRAIQEWQFVKDDILKNLF